jgi:hypothetical protein
MSRAIERMLGFIEVLAAGGLLALGLSLPAREEVRRSFDGARQVSAAAGEQVRGLRGQVTELRQSRLRGTASRLGAAVQVVAANTRRSRVDFEALRAIRDASGRAADGLDRLTQTEEPSALDKLSAGLGATADFLDRNLVPAASKAADGLDAAAGRLRASARQFGELVRAVPLDLKPVQELYDGLARFDAGLGALQATFDPRRLDALGQAAHGAEGVVAEAAQMADRAAGYTYPVVVFEGLTPRVRNRPFWPGAAKAGADLRKVSSGVVAMGQEIETLSAELPRIQEGVAESRRVVGATRQALAATLKRQGEVELLLRQMPEQAARLGDELPRLTGTLAGALRDAGRLEQVATALRQSRKGIDSAVASWPEVRKGLSGSAVLLRATRDQLDSAIEHREEYEAAQEDLEALYGEFAKIMPALAEGFDARLDQEDRSLTEMAGGIAQVDAALPAYSAALDRCLLIGRGLSWLAAAIAALHGFLLIGPSRPTTSATG